MCALLISHVAMEYRTLVGEEPVGLVAPGYAGGQIEETSAAQLLFKRLVEPSANARIVLSCLHIDGNLHAAAISSTPVIGSRVGIAQDVALFAFCHDVGVMLQRTLYPLCELLHRRHFVLKGDGCLTHVRCIYLPYLSGICGSGRTQCDGYGLSLASHLLS